VTTGTSSSGGSSPPPASSSSSSPVDQSRLNAIVCILALVVDLVACLKGAPYEYVLGAAVAIAGKTDVKNITALFRK
jgi:hypothetical protein